MIKNIIIAFIVGSIYMAILLFGFKLKKRKLWIAFYIGAAILTIILVWLRG